MRRTFQLIMFLKSLATGIMAPVLAMALLAHGAAIGTISLLLGAYSFTVIVAEFPSGVFADVYGRKMSFLLSAVLFLLSYGLMLVSRSMEVLFFAVVANGLGRAFSTGSMDALIIDHAGTDDGQLVRITARLSILESAGLAAGALAGGFLSALGTLYAGNLIANFTIYLLLLMLTAVRVREQPRTRAAEEGKTGGVRKAFGAQVKESLAFMGQKGRIRTLFVLSLVTGFALISMETYWQPALASYSPAPWVFGIVSFAMYFCVIVGSRLMERLLLRRPACGMALLLGQKALFGGCLILLVYGANAPFFVTVFMLVYLFLGGSGVAESTLLNQQVPASRRASILSLFSFILQIGGLMAALTGYAVSTGGDFRNMWLIAGVLVLLCATWFALVQAGSRHHTGNV